MNDFYGDFKEFRKEVLDKLDNVNINLATNNQKLKDYNVHLETHIKRTDLLEARMNKVEIPFKTTTYIFAALGVLGSLIAIIQNLITYLHK